MTKKLQVRSIPDCSQAPCFVCFRFLSLRHVCPYHLVGGMAHPSPGGSIKKVQLHQSNFVVNKLRWYPQQPQRFIFTNLSEGVLRSQALKTPQRAPKPPRPSPEPSPEPCWTWPGSAPKPPGTFSGTLLNLTWLLRNLLRNPVEPNLALHQSLPDLLRNLLRNLALRQSIPDLLGNLRNLLRNPVEPDLALHQSLPGLLRNLLWNPLNLTWFCTKASWNLLRNLLRNPVELTWFCTKASQTFTGTFPGTLLNLTWLCTKASQTFSGTFSGTWLCAKASQTFSGTFGTFSGTSLNLTRRLHQRTPELFWAEDPISFRCWEKM